MEFATLIVKLCERFSAGAYDESTFTCEDDENEPNDYAFQIMEVRLGDASFVAVDGVLILPDVEFVEQYVRSRIPGFTAHWQSWRVLHGTPPITAPVSQNTPTSP